MKFTRFLLCLFLAVATATSTVPNGLTLKSPGLVARAGSVGTILLKDRSDAIAVWDMQTLDTGKIANLVPGSSEYDLTLSSTRLGGSNPVDDPVVNSEGVAFPPFGANQNEGIAAGTGTASITSGATIYVAFKRTGVTSGGAFGFTTLVKSTLALIRSLDPEEAPRIHAPTASPYVIGRWNDGLPHLLAATVEPTRVRMYLDGCQILDFVDAATFPVTLSNFDFSELTKGFAGTIYHASVFNTVHDVTTRANVFSQVQTALALRSVTVSQAGAFIIFEGDSITESGYITGAAQQYPYLSITTLTPVRPAINFAHHSDAFTHFNTRASDIDAVIAASTSPVKVLSLLATNDVQYGGDGTVAFASLTSYCAARKAANPGLLIVVGTAVVRDVAGYEADRLVYNGLINGGDPSYDAVADYGGDAELGNPANAVFNVGTTYFTDGIHPNVAGHARMTPILRTRLQALGIVPPTLVSATINSAGTSLSLVFAATVSIGTGGNGGFVLDPTGADVTLTYVSGSGSTSLVYTISRAIYRTADETAVLNYTQPSNGVEGSNGADVASLSAFAVTNNSTQVNVTESLQQTLGGTYDDTVSFAYYERIASKFTASGNFTCTRIDAYIAGNGGTPTSGNINAKIYTVSGGNPGTLVGTASANINRTSLGGLAYYTFSGLSATLVSGTDYFIMLESAANDGAVYWVFQTSGGSSSKGSRAGAAWDGLSTKVGGAKLYGN